MPGRTLYRKLVDAHTVVTLDADNVLLYADLHIMNEYTSPQAFAGLDEHGRGVPAPGQQLAVVDHIIPTHAESPRVIRDPASALQARNLKRNCARHGIPLFDTDDPLQGIEHVITPEHGMIRPGMVVLCGDSHTTTYGAFGALGFGIGTSEVEHVLATQTLVYRVARDMRIRIDGTLPAGTTSKDLILHVIACIGAQGARGYAVEFAGSAIGALSMEARMTLCNMTVEAGARGALIAPDATSIDYVLARAPDIDAGAARAVWRDLASDADAAFDAEFAFDAAEVAPYVTWGPARTRRFPSVRPFPRRPMRPIPSRGPRRHARSTISASRPALRSRVCRCSACLSARAPMAGSRTCARWPTWCAGAASRPAYAQWSCPVRARYARRPRPKASRRCLPTRASNGASPAARCAWP